MDEALAQVVDASALEKRMGLTRANVALVGPLGRGSEVDMQLPGGIGGRRMGGPQVGRAGGHQVGSSFGLCWAC